MNTQNNRIGIDIGRVIIAGDAGSADTSFFGNDTQAMLRTPMVAGAFDAIRTITDEFGGQVWLVSKCGPRIQQRSMQWLDHHGFWGLTGVDRENVRFCLERREKAGIARDLDLTHFVDDKADVHRALGGIVGHRYLFGPDVTLPAAPGVIHTPTWADVLRHLTRA